jgi:hypothetical protein
MIQKRKQINWRIFENQLGILNLFNTAKSRLN